MTADNADEAPGYLGFSEDPTHHSRMTPNDADRVIVALTTQGAVLSTRMDQVFEVNKENKAVHQQFDVRISRLERLAIFWVGLSAGTGTALGTMASHLFQ